MKTYLKVITKYYPEFENSEVSIITRSQNNKILVLNGITIFRFPKSDINKKSLEVEIKCLPILKEEIHFKIPTFTYKHMGDTIHDTFVGYDMIHGVTLTRAVFETKDIQMIGDQLSAILKSLHQKHLKEKFEKMIPVLKPDHMWADMYKRIKEKLFPLIKEALHDQIERDFNSILEAYKDASFETTLVHGDFGPSNILVNQSSSQITGIIDFGEIHIGDPAEDIASLIGPTGYGDDLILNHFQNYPEASAMLKRAKLMTKTFALQEALYGIEHDDADALEAGLKNYR